MVLNLASLKEFPIVHNYQFLQNFISVLEQNKIVYSLVILVAFYLLSEIVKIIFTKIILHVTHRTKTEIDDKIVAKTRRPISMILILIGIRIALLPLGLPEGVLNVLEDILIAITTVVIIVIVIRISGVLIDEWGLKVAKKTASTLDDQLVPVFHRFSKIVISLIGLLFILPVFGIQVGPLVTSLGIAGIAVAFALQTTLGNIFGGISIILDKSVKIGDKVRIDAETSGFVEDVGLRSTKIKTFDNEFVTVPNGKLAESKIINLMLPDPRIRLTINFSVEYGSDVEQVKKIVHEAVSKINHVLQNPIILVIFTQMGDFALQFQALFWIESHDYKGETISAANEAIYNALRNNKIRIPFPTRTVYMKKE